MREDPLLKIKTIDLELKLLIKSHTDALDNYTTSIRNNNVTKSREYHAKLAEINQTISKLLEHSAELESKIVLETGGKSVALLEHDLQNVSKKLNNNRKKIRNLEHKFRNVEGVNASAALKTGSERTKYIFISILMVIVLILTVRAFVYEPKTIDIIFIVSAFFLMVFHFFDKQV